MLIMANFGVAFALNSILMSQIAIYWGKKGDYGIEKPEASPKSSTKKRIKKARKDD